MSAVTEGTGSTGALSAGALAAGAARRIVVVTAGLSQPSSTRLLADRLAAAVRARADVEVRVVELRDLANEIAHNMVTGFPGPRLREAIDAVTAADGLIAVTPVFTGSYSGLFKSFFDVIDKDALAGTPVLAAATGGTARHSLVLDHALRPLFAYLRAVVVPTAVYAASEDWGAAGNGTSGGALAARMDRAAAELVALLPAAAPRAADPETALPAPAGPVPPPAAEPAPATQLTPIAGGAPASTDPFEDVVPFAEQLAALTRG
ncbi:CE1759 family FMN reductase [Streptomyces sp. NPDC051976]|uniref:CE1759 family FMN reductase n=1 Tax=Streptomyces sp. NPDC051976 TaxID=3154947 RepID=UPI003432344E